MFQFYFMSKWIQASLICSLVKDYMYDEKSRTKENKNQTV